MRFPRDIKHIIATDYFGVEYLKPVEDIPVPPTREQRWAAWGETQARNDEWRKGRGDEGQSGTIPVTAINKHHELKLIQDETGI